MYIVFSIAIIYTLHNLYTILKNCFTVKKIRFQGEFQNEKYQEILVELKNHKSKTREKTGDDSRMIFSSFPERSEGQTELSSIDMQQYFEKFIETSQEMI
jgi:hypothetical protein